MRITKISALTGRVHSREIDVDERRLTRWRLGHDGRLIQHVFPELSAADREFLLTGTTPQEWEQIKAYEEES